MIGWNRASLEIPSFIVSSRFIKVVSLFEWEKTRWTNVFRIGGLHNVSWFQFLPSEAELNPSSDTRAEQNDVATYLVLSSHLRLQKEGFLTTWTNSFVGAWDPSQGLYNPDEKIKLWLFLPGRHSSISDKAQAAVSKLRGIWVAPGDAEEISVAFSVFTALSGLSYMRFGDVFSKVSPQSEDYLRRGRLTVEFVFAATEEAVFVHVIVSAKNVRTLSSGDAERLSLSRWFVLVEEVVESRQHLQHLIGICEGLNKSLLSESWRFFFNPENALKRAEELINVGQKQDALQVLHNLITSRGFRSWQKPHEKIMFRYVELCVDLKMGKFAKDGLIQYRNSCQQVNVTSFEEVTKQLVRLATEKAEEALDEKALDVDGLEVTPWFKLLWETYRTVLDILRNNSKLQALYAITAHKAFQFCKNNKRPTEFRRLCEIMRNNLANLDKYRDQRDRPDLTEPETLQLYLDTRFEHLKVATELGLWQEAFRSVEDIYGLMCMVKKTPKSSLLVVYYSKLTEIFWTSSSHLYHAYAWLKLFSLQKNFNKKLSQKDLQLLASSVVLAALSVPPFGLARGASRLEFETEKEGNLKMANLIGFNLELKFESRDMLSRESLLSELVSSGVLSCATEEVKDLYHQLEHEFHPLDLGSKTKPLLDRISKLGGKLSTAPSLPEVQLSQYVPSLKKLATLRLLQHVSKMYQTIKIQFLAQLVPFLDFSDVEKISVEAVKHNFIAMKVDHVKGFITFGILGIESDGLRDPLTIFAETMNKVRAMLFPASSKLGDTGPNLGETVEKEHKRLLARQSFIEKRKEEQERQLLEMEHEEEKRKLTLRMQTEEAEQKRLASEVEERRRQRILREIEEREVEKAQALLENTENHQIKVEEMERKLLKLAKRMDYLERAKREESTPLIESAYQQRLVEEIEYHEHEQQREFELSRERHESDLKEKRRVTRMLSSESFVENMDIFQNRVIRLREAEFERQKREKEEHLQARKQERDVKRKRIYYLKCEEERIRKLQEEEEARKQRDAAGPSQSGKYIPKFRLSQATEVSGSSDDQWGSRRPQHSGRDNAAPLVEGDQCGNGGERPGGDSWRSEKEDIQLEVAAQGLPSHQEPLNADACVVEFWSQFP